MAVGTGFIYWFARIAPKLIVVVHKTEVLEIYMSMYVTCEFQQLINIGCDWIHNCIFNIIPLLSDFTKYFLAFCSYCIIGALHVDVSWKLSLHTHTHTHTHIPH